jgi:TolB-like protein
MNFFAELKRRNVIRMAGLYLVGAWLLVQVAGTLLPVFDAPAWVMKTLVGLLAACFIPALVFSWVFELTPKGLKRDEDVKPEESIAPQTARRMNRMIIAVLVLALGYFGFDKFVLTPRREVALVAATEKSVAARPSAESKALANAKSIAVLPFVNMSADTGNQYFSDGISEELLNALVHVDGIEVASRTSSFAYRGSPLGTTAIAAALRVGYIVEGSVRKSGDRVRITAQLIDALHDRHLFSETYDRDLTDIFAIQDEIANAVVAALRGTLAGAQQAPRVVKVRADTENLQAYDLYLKARELFIARKDLKESIQLFEKVVELDSKFARGWEGLAAVCAVAESWGIRDRAYTALAKRAAERALELDPSLSMPWAALAQVEQRTLPVNWEKALALSDRAIAADPKNATAYLWRSISWINLGFFKQAMADQDRALAIDPNYQNCERWKALALLFNGDTDQALAAFERGVAGGFIVNRADSFVPPLLQRGNRMAALLLMEAMGGKPELSKILLEAVARPGAPRPDARATVERYMSAKDDRFVWRFSRAKAYLWLGDYDQVADATDDDDPTNIIAAWERVPASFRNSPGFKRLLERLGVPAYWRKHGFPPQCRPLGATDFECK